MSVAHPTPATPRPSRLPVPLRLALRELRGARRGFGVFLACLALGVMAIAGIGSFTRALTEGLDREGRAILGGDVAFSVVQRQATEPEMARLAARGTVGSLANLRAMARAASGDAAMVDMKAVDGTYPLAGTLELEPPRPLAEVLAPVDDVYGAAADDVLFSRLGLKVGDRIKVGDATFELRAQVKSEPDKLSSGLGFGSRLLVAQEALPATNLIRPGSLVRWTYRLRLPSEDPALLSRTLADIREPFAAAGFEVRSRDGASPQLERNVARISQYLTLVGLTALLVGGVGVANAVSSHLARKRTVIATLKAVGATRGNIFATYLTEVFLLAAVGIALGLALGAALPFLAAVAISTLIPFPLVPRIDAGALGLAALYGLLVTAAFTLWPVAQAQEAPVSTLFRDALGEARRRPSWLYVAACLAAVAALAVVAIATAEQKWSAALFLGAAALAFALLRLVGLGIMAVARRLPRPRAPMARLALANIHRPGALTPTVVLSLGLGLTLLVAVALIDRSLTEELNGPIREKAPSFFFVDIPSAAQDDFTRFIAAKAPDATLKTAPMLRGRITHLNGVPADQARPSSDAAWVLQSDRGITYGADMPEGSLLAEGQWWTSAESEPLLSFEDKLAAGLGLKVGDTVTVNVLGRSITARIANLRHVAWERLGINFVMQFSPRTFAGAPHSVLATLTFPDGADTAAEIALMREVAAAFPNVTTVRVKETLEEAGKMVADLSLGIRIASLVTLITSVLVLAGALAAGHQYRVYDAVILKTLGATRPRLIGAYALEYAALGVVTAVFAVAAGSLAAFVVVTRVMEIHFAFAPGVAALAVLVALVFTVGFGLVGTWRALSEAPVRVLRHL